MNPGSEVSREGITWIYFIHLLIIVKMYGFPLTIYILTSFLGLEKFGQEYENYRRQVPMFFPRLSDWPKIVSGGFRTAT